MISITTNLLMSLILLLYGSIIFIDNYIIIILISIICRFFQGFCAGAIFTYTFYSLYELNNNLSKDKRKKKFFIGRIFLMLGLAFGPLTGILFNSLFGYIGIFAFSSIYALFESIFIFFIFPEKEFNEIINLKEQKIIEKVEEKEIKKNINYFPILKNFQVLISFIFFLFLITGSIFPNMGFTTNIVQTFNYSINSASLIYMIYGFTSIIMSLFLYFISFNLLSIASSHISLFLQCFALLLIGPCSSIGIPKNINFVILGLAINSISSSIFAIHIIPIFINLFDICENAKKWSEKDKTAVACSFNNTLWSIADFISPFFSGILIQEYTYKNANSIYSSISFCYFLFYFIWVGRHHLIKEIKKKTVKEIF